ncbi:MAG: hypothetical protein AAB407_03735 [Patescibacteria group bacterium]
MDQLMKADIFFFISSIATVVLTALVSILLFYLIKAGKNLSELSEVLKGNIKESKEFIQDLKERLEDNIVFRLFFPSPRKRKETSAKNHKGKSNT